MKESSLEKKLHQEKLETKTAFQIETSIVSKRNGYRKSGLNHDVFVQLQEIQDSRWVSVDVLKQRLEEKREDFEKRWYKTPYPHTDLDALILSAGIGLLDELLGWLGASE